MRQFSFPFLAILYFVVTNIKCAEKSTILNRESRLFELSELKNVFNFSDFSENVINGSRLNLTESELRVELTEEREEAGRKCLKNVTHCMEEDKTYQQSSEKLLNFIATTLPPFDLSTTPGVSLPCQRDSRKYVNDLKKFKLWALKMYDSSAKLPSGLLNGNVNQLGDFDMCLSALSEDHDVSGQYCLASLEIQKPRSQYLAGLHRLIQSHYHFRSKLEDPGHRVPRFSSINWALCVPNSCTPDDVRKGLKKTVRRILDGTELEVRYEVDPDMCQTATRASDVPSSTIIAIAIFAAIILFELFATFYDLYAIGEKSKWITSFSLKKNFNTLTSINRSPGDIQAVHGIRMLNAVLLLLAHKSMAVFFMPYSNRTYAVEYLGRPFSVVARAASLYTDPFIMISGLLTSYSLIGKLDKTGKINIGQEYISRLYRIVPTFAALIAFCTFILPWLAEGPMWNLVVTHHSDICKKNWWRNLMFIHNYFGFKDMCLTHTHHLGIDTQLFFTSPFMIYGLWRWPLKGATALTTIATISTVARFYVTYTMRLSNYVHFGTSVQQLFDTADNMYILPPHRATVYIMGIFMGYILRKHGNVTLSKVQIRMGNTLAIFSFLVSYLGPSFMSKIDYIYNPTHAAWYAAVSPILWTASFCWVIYSSQLGYTGTIGKLLSHPIWTLWTKVSYTVYLTQFPIFFFNVGVTRSAHEFGFFSKMLNVQEYSWVLGLSLLLSILFELPFQNVRTLMLKRTENSADKVKKVS
ncbi:O-acyltransferase like protein-like [Anthonomus grandis grandis]|uniref:O-acyltransferase like protein-like n=1 Tax=Anthonomus grandis grandis TaxID=2921223 RepID=UPI002165331B|nr:O-acyltransferase like protein-like [Anthonomus grandis grandis]